MMARARTDRRREGPGHRPDVARADSKQTARRRRRQRRAGDAGARRAARDRRRPASQATPAAPRRREAGSEMDSAVGRSGRSRPKISTAVYASIGRQRGSSGRTWPRASASGSSRTAATAQRARTRVEGAISVTATLISRYGMPQITHIAANRTQPRLDTRHRLSSPPDSGARICRPGLIPAGGFRPRSSGAAGDDGGWSADEPEPEEGRLAGGGQAVGRAGRRGAGPGPRPGRGGRGAAEDLTRWPSQPAKRR